MTTIPRPRLDRPSRANLTTDQWAALTVNDWSRMEVAPTFRTTYDAWNRLVKLTDGGNGETVQENEYDGRGYRIITRTCGEGRYPGAFNVNPHPTGGYVPGAEGIEAVILNRVAGSSTDILFPSGTVGQLNLENAPIGPGTGPEIGRVLGPGGSATLHRPEGMAGAHQSVAEVVGGTVQQTTQGGMVTTTITRSGQ